MSDTIPAHGTKSAVRYWAKCARASMRDAEQMMQAGEWSLAVDLALQASGEAGEMHQAMDALADTHRA